MQRNCVRVDDDNQILGPCTRQETLDGAAFRAVWGMVYHPYAKRWALQWRRPDKGICPLQWDMSCAGHVDWVDGAAESYQTAYARELDEELGLETSFWRDPVTLVDAWTALKADGNPKAALTLDLGTSREYLETPVRGGETRLVREHPGQFLTLYAGPLTLLPDAEPLALAWMSTTEVHEIILDAGLSGLGLANMLDRCSVALPNELRTGPSAP